jgi:hypothetical protein
VSNTKLGAQGERSPRMKRPDWVTNEASWKKTCRKVVARARDLSEGRIGVIVCAREMSKLAFWLRAEEDPDFKVFRAIESESIDLPAGTERQRWSVSALEREDKKISEFKSVWRGDALAAAAALMKKYESNQEST